MILIDEILIWCLKDDFTEHLITGKPLKPDYKFLLARFSP
jgi:hypothetical protein